MKQGIIPVVTFEPLEPDDLLSALTTLDNHIWTKVIIPSIGNGFEVFLKWALHDIEEAEAGTDNDSRGRHAVNAVMNARRALSCLIDQYLQRDGFAFCGDAPSGTDEKTTLLIRRGVIDQLAAQALKRAVDKRHGVEHQYKSLELATAQDVVHMVRATIENATSRSSPYASPGLFGIVMGGISSGKRGRQAWFNGWSGPALILVTTMEPQWLGIIVPSNEAKAVVRKVDLAEISHDQLLKALEVRESKVTPEYSDCSMDSWHLRLRSWGLIQEQNE